MFVSAGLSAGLIVTLIVTVFLQERAEAQFGNRSELKLVARFDKNGDDRLDAAERKAARAAAGQGGAGGFFGGGRRRGGAVASPGKPMAPADVKSGGAAPLYDTGTLRTIFLTFENPDWEAELEDFYNSDVDVPAVAVVDGKTYRDVGVHFRGASSYMMTGRGSKRSLNLAFDFADGKQRLLGARTLNLLNVAGDPTFIRPVIYAEIASKYLNAPKANFMRVVINGENWGIYVNSEQFNTDFTRERYGSGSGARWKVPGSPGGGGGLAYFGEDVNAYKDLYEIKSKDDPASWAELIKVSRILNQTPIDKLEAALAPILDIDETLKFLAVEVALVNSDGYWSRASDFSIYQDPKGRFHIIPHDTNEALSGEGGGRGGGFGRGGFGGGGVSLSPLVAINDSAKPLRSRLLAVPALRARYLQYVRDIAEQSLDWNTLGPAAAKHRALIEADVKADTKKLFPNAAFDAGLGDGPEGLRSFVEQRRAFLLKAQ
jgi:hypothetical protein